MTAMASYFDVLYLEDSLWVSCKDVKKQGSLRYCMLSALLAMVEMFRALQSLWITLLPYALLWWDVLLHAMCAKYYLWNRSRLWLQEAGQVFCSNTMEEACANPEEAGKTHPSRSQQRGLSVDTTHGAKSKEMSIVSLCRPGRACAEAVHGEKKDKASFPYLQRNLPGSGVDAADIILHLLNQDGAVVAACLEDSTRPHRAVKAQAVFASSHSSKLSTLCFLEEKRGLSTFCLSEERGHVVDRSAEYCLWATCSSLLPHQVRPLSMLGVCQCGSILSCLQIILEKNRGMLLLKVPLCIDHVSMNWSVLRKSLQSFDGSRIPGSNHSKKFPNTERALTKVLTSRTRSGNYVTSQFILSTTDNNNIASSYGVAENAKLWIEEYQELSGFRVQNNTAYLDDGDCGLDRSEDTGSACCNPIKSDDECEDGTYCTSTEFTTDADDGLEYSDAGYSARQCYTDGGHCYYTCCRGNEDSGVYSIEDTMDPRIIHNGFYDIEDTENVCTNFDLPAMYNSGSFHECSAPCNVLYDAALCGTDVDEICGVDYDADESDYASFDRNAEIGAAVLGNFYSACEGGADESPGKIHAPNSNTWWDKDAVLINEKETEEERIEEEWEVV